jgi:DNA polymerase alpha subunit B
MHSADLSYKPLDDLFVHLQEIRPDVLVLCGPFADASHRLLDPAAFGTPAGFSNGDPPDSLELARRVVREHVVSGLKLLGGIKCVMIPSILDLHSTCVYPQPPFEGEIILPGANDSYEFSEPLPVLLSNPCTFKINEIVVSISTTDILLHLSGNEASRLSSDRLSRLARHVIEQVRS